MVEYTAGYAEKSYPAGRTVSVKPCDFCISSPALLFCRKDTVFLCMSCDANLHGHTKHERVWMCCACEHAPACVTCDKDTHTANPVVPFYDSAEAVVNSTASNLTDPVFGYETKEEDNNRKIPRNVTSIDNDSLSVTKSIDLLSSEYYRFNFDFRFNDSVNDAAPIADHRSKGNRYEIGFNKSVNNIYNKLDSQSDIQTVPCSSMENSLSDVNVSNPLMLRVNGGRMLSAKDREARVLRYREKRKRRKFEKKIRYASRKAYAEMRPRIRGRFAKRTELMTVLDLDRWWFTAEYIIDSSTQSQE